MYNVDQCEGLPESFLEEGVRQIREVEPVAEAEAMANNYLAKGGPLIRYVEYEGTYRMSWIRGDEGANYR